MLAGQLYWLIIDRAPFRLESNRGAVMQPFPNTGHLNEGARINALCETAGGLYAAAVESSGLVFFDRQGRTVEVLDHSLDQSVALLAGGDEN